MEHGYRLLQGVVLAVLLPLYLLLTSPAAYAQGDPFTCANDEYFLGRYEGGTTPPYTGSQLSSIDPNGMPLTNTTIGPLAPVAYNGMGLNPVDGYMYATVERVEVSPGVAHGTVYRIASDGTVTSLGVPQTGGTPLANVRGWFIGAFASDGTYTIGNGSTRVMAHVDVTTTPPTILSQFAMTLPPGVNRIVADWDYNPADGMLYGWANVPRHPVVINPATGVFSDLCGGANLGLTMVGGAFFNASGEFIVYSNAGGTLYEVDLTLPCSVTLVGTFPPGNLSSSDAAACQANFLPVELTQFEAILDGQALNLVWETASETNNAGFEVQRLAEFGNVGWEALGFVEGHGTTIQPQHYAFRVENMTTGRYRFRLKQVDYDGSFEYSPEVEVAVDLPSAYHLTQAYPNPFNPQTQFSLSVAQRQHVAVTIHDQTGRQVASLFDGVLEAQTTRAFTFRAEALPSGVYVVRVVGERVLANQTITLIK